MRSYIEDILQALQRRGWKSEEARRRLEQTGWMALLPPLEGELSPEAVADDMQRHTRCETCGHPLHPVVGDVVLSVLGRPHMVRHLPHTAACSCGYARPLVPEVWAATVAAHFRRHPQAPEVDARDLRTDPTA